VNGLQVDEPTAREAGHRTSIWQRWRATTLSNQVVAASTLVIALSTIINLAVAIAQWDVLRNTEKQTQKSFQIDGTPQFAQPPNTAGIPVSANVVFKDIGKTPAIETVWFVDLLPYRATNRANYLEFVENAFADLRKRRDATVKEHATEIGRDIAPAATTFSTENSRALSGPEMTDIAKGDGSFILLSVGIVNYTDAFGGSYETEFCYFFAGSDPRVWHICDAHNTIR
jgi:hypothetical protein